MAVQSAITFEGTVLPRRLYSLLLVLAVGLLVPFPTRAAAQDASDIIRGRVIGPDKKPLENVSVTATSLVNHTSRTAKSNKDGRFTIIFNGGGGDYLMTFASIGDRNSTRLNSRH